MRLLTANRECVAEQVMLANTAWKRLRGLLGRRRLGANEALWLRPCNGVHTFWMLFAIDVLFLDRELRVVRIVENMRPFRLTLPVKQARSVMELPAHAAARCGIRLGDQLHLERTDTATTTQSPAGICRSQAIRAFPSIAA